jgi:hypothetical protein
LASTYNILVDQGSTYTLAVTYKDSSGTAINLTGYTAAMQLRENYDSATAVLSLSSPSSGIVITGASGLVTITMSATQTAALSADTFLYDLEIASPASVKTRLIQGVVVVSAEVTK